MNKRLLLCLFISMLLVTLCSCAKNEPKAIAIDHFLLPESAIPAGWEVYIRDKDSNGNITPYIMEVDGPEYGFFGQKISLPRSMFDTKNNHIQQVAIVFMGR